MGNPVNKRVLMLKTHLGLTDIEFCGRASISTGTLQKLKGSEQVTHRVLNAIITAFNVNKDWLMTGKGEMIAEEKEEAITNDPWKDQAWILAKQQIEKKDATIDRLSVAFERMTEFLSRVEGNFLHPVRETGS